MTNPNLQILHGILYGKGLRIGKLSPLGQMMASMVGIHGDYVPSWGRRSTTMP